MVPKLKFEHIALTSFSKMRVDLAAQVSMHVAYFTLHNNYVYISNFIGSQ